MTLLKWAAILFVVALILAVLGFGGLAEGIAELSDSVFGEEGTWRDGSRTIRDTSPHEWLSLRDALRVSSNRNGVNKKGYVA